MSPISESVDAVDQLIDRIGQLHASPTVAQKLLQLTRRPEFEISEVAGCLEHDPALAARILRIVNSSPYGLARKVSNIRHAAAYLGQPSLRMFAITFALVETVTSRSQSLLTTSYWPRALTLATAASLLSETHAPQSRDDAYTSGLLADVGILILAQLEPRRYESLFGEHEHGERLLEAEQETFQFTHPQLGARLLELWEVPDPVVHAVANHHSLTAQGDILSQVVQAADLLSAAINEPTPDKMFLAALRLHQKFGMNREQLISFTLTLEERIADGEDIVDCSKVLNKRLHEFLGKIREGVEDSQGVGL
jgi:HD-like signal output (HDOD) protein